jgi:molybdopterin-containing oxidoreductase family iron-sulfur binding subunit
MSSNKILEKCWRTRKNGSIVEALRNNEFVEAISTEESLEVKRQCLLPTSRRDFKVRWSGTAAATLAACEGPVNKSIPYVLQPEQIIPGEANENAKGFTINST